MAQTLLKGRYNLLAEVGRGETTVTYKAQDAELNRTVLVKVLREPYADQAEFVASFQGAYQAAAALSHPNIVAVFDVGSDAGLHYIVTEYVEGPSLEALLASQGRLSVEQSLNLAIGVCAALGAAHQAGVVHGRLTPRNILVTGDQVARVTDFGVIHAPAAIPVAEEPSSRYAALYVSPERAMGRRIVPASDVYALGVILYEMLAGEPPFQGDSTSILAEQHIREEPKPLHLANPSVPQALSSVVHRALVKRSGGRYRTVADLRSALVDYRRRSAEAEVAARVRTEERTLALERLHAEERTTPPELAAEERGAESYVARRAGPDWVGIILGMIAVLAVLGLVPLWLAVFLRYFS